MGIHSTFPQPRTLTLGLSRADRKTIEAEIERLIAMLDAHDGDPDLEDDDPAGDILDRGEAQDASAILPVRPIYGADQSAGPINEKAAYQDWLRRMRGEA